MQIDGRFSCVCPAIDHEFRHNIIKVAVDPRVTADRRMKNCCSFSAITNRQIVRPRRSLCHKFIYLPAY